MVALALAVAGVAPGRAQEPALPSTVRAVFFDLGDTLVTKPRRWVPGARAALDRLAAAGIALGIISNTGDLARSALLAGHLPPDFAFADFDPRLVLLSAEQGVAKPDPRIFYRAAVAARLPRREIVFLDEGEEMVRAARRAGLVALQVAIERDPDGSLRASGLEGLVERLARRGPTARP